MVQDAATREKDFPELIPSILARLIYFIYTGWFPCILSSQHLDSDGSPSFTVRKEDLFASVEDNVELELKLYAQMYATAAKFLLEDLKEMSIRRFCICFSYNCGTKDDPWRPPRVPTHQVLTASLAKLIYNSTPEGDCDLRDTLLTFLMRDLWRLDYHHGSMPIYKNLIVAVPELAYDILANELRPMRFQCRKCDAPKFRILAHRCECGHGIYHTEACDADHKKEGRCPNCGRTGCLEWADGEFEKHDDNNSHDAIEESTTTLVGWDNSAAW